MSDFDIDDGPRSSFHARISERAHQRVRADADRLKLPIGTYVEMLIFDRGFSHTDYFAQQAAIQSFISTGLLVGVVAQVAGPEKVEGIRRQAVEAAAALFGQARERPPGIGSAAPTEDPRIAALFAAFGAG